MGLSRSLAQTFAAAALVLGNTACYARFGYVPGDYALHEPVYVAPVRHAPPHVVVHVEASHQPTPHVVVHTGGPHNPVQVPHAPNRPVKQKPTQGPRASYQTPVQQNPVHGPHVPLGPLKNKPAHR
jgi:hypothetical protein